VSRKKLKPEKRACKLSFICVLPFRAEEIKRSISQGNLSSGNSTLTQLKTVEYRNERPQSSRSFNNPKLDELLRLSSATPALKTALEIGQSAEFYEKEAQYGTAIERYADFKRDFNPFYVLCSEVVACLLDFCDCVSLL